MGERAAQDEPERTPWHSVFLICKQCRKRNKAPKGLKPKALAAILRAQSREQRPRPRAVSTSCLGLCPKGAIAVAFLGGGGQPRFLRIESREQLAAAIPLLTAPRL